MDGAAVVSVSVSGFHSSEEDSHKIGDATSAQLQLHATQTTPMAQYIAPLAWASLASIFARSASITKLPTIEPVSYTHLDVYKRQAWKWAAFAIGLILSLLLTYTLLQNLGLFLDFLIPLLVIVLHTFGEELIKLWHEFQHLKQHARQGLAEKR